MESSTLPSAKITEAVPEAAAVPESSGPLDRTSPLAGVVGETNLKSFEEKKAEDNAKQLESLAERCLDYAAARLRRRTRGAKILNNRKVYVNDEQRFEK